MSLNSLLIGGGKSNGTMQFNPAFIGGSVTPTLTMQGTGGSGSQVANILIGDGTPQNTGGSTSTAGVLDLTGGNVTVYATNIYLGRTRQGGATDAARTYSGTLTFDTGTINTTNMYVGYQSVISSTLKPGRALSMLTARQI